MIYPMYIDGEWVTVEGSSKDVVSPATGEVIGTITPAGAAEVERALKAADNRIVLVIGTQNKKAATLIREYRAIQPHLVIEPISESKLLPQLENEEEMLELLYTF